MAVGKGSPADTPRPRAGVVRGMSGPRQCGLAGNGCWQRVARRYSAPQGGGRARDEWTPTVCLYFHGGPGFRHRATSYTRPDGHPGRPAGRSAGACISMAGRDSVIGRPRTRDRMGTLAAQQAVRRVCMGPPRHSWIDLDPPGQRPSTALGYPPDRSIRCAWALQDTRGSISIPQGNVRAPHWGIHPTGQSGEPIRVASEVCLALPTTATGEILDASGAIRRAIRSRSGWRRKSAWRCRPLQPAKSLMPVERFDGLFGPP